MKVKVSFTLFIDDNDPETLFALEDVTATDGGAIAVRNVLRKDTIRCIQKYLSDNGVPSEVIRELH